MVPENLFHTLALSSPSRHKSYKEPRIKLFKKINKSVPSHKTFYLDDDHKAVDYNGGTLSFTCQLNKI